VRAAGNAEEEPAVTEDLAARVAELAAAIEAGLAEDEAVALATIGINERASMLAGQPPPRWVPEPGGSGIRSEDRYGILRVKHTWANERAHIVRNDPARVLRRVKATRDLVAAILAERHDYNDGDEFYSCSQAAEPGTDGEPGSGCANDERAGKPCDCGRDMRVARLLGIIASEWEADGA
jgi:Family of unknown function (DUF6221)